MGGGNGLKSHMAKGKKVEKEKSGGGGAAGKEERSGMGVSVICAICKTNFRPKMVEQMKVHQGSKHPKNSLGECFVGVTF